MCHMMYIVHVYAENLQGCDETNRGLKCTISEDMQVVYKTEL